jgi:hypothetical protein
MPKWLAVISGCDPILKQWLAITSDSKPFSKMGKTRRQKDGFSFYRVKFIWAWITLYPCFLDLMYASVHHFLYKKRNLLFYRQYFPFYAFPESTCANLGGTMRFCLKINLNSNFDKFFHSINNITYLSFNIPID